jgi:hypothetical protein
MYIDGNLTALMTQYTSFTDLGSEGEVKDLFFGFYPMQYEVNYTKYTKDTMSATIATSYRLYGAGDYTLANLPTLADTYGYKLTNQMMNENSSADLSILNEWFISNEAMKPGDPTINSVNSLLADNITVYSYETPKTYTVICYDFTSGENIEYFKDTGKYGTPFTMPSLPVFTGSREGHATNPTGWV